VCTTELQTRLRPMSKRLRHRYHRHDIEDVDAEKDGQVPPGSGRKFACTGLTLLLLWNNGMSGFSLGEANSSRLAVREPWGWNSAMRRILTGCEEALSGWTKRARKLNQSGFLCNPWASGMLVAHNYVCMYCTVCTRTSPLSVFAVSRGPFAAKPLCSGIIWCFRE
jgi:hypothetical protein